MNHERLELDSGGRADQDDRPATAAVDDVLGTGHHGVPGAGEVDVDDVSPLLGGDGVPGMRSSDAGVGDDDIETAELGDTVVDGLTQPVVIAGVDG